MLSPKTSINKKEGIPLDFLQQIFSFILNPVRSMYPKSIQDDYALNIK